ADLVGAIANEAGVPGDAIGDIDLYDTFSFVEVPEEEVETVRAALNATTIRGRAPRASVALPAGDWQTDTDVEERRRPGLGRGEGRDGRDHNERPTGRGWSERDNEARRPTPYWERAGREERRSLRVPPRAARTPAAGRKGGARSERPFERGGRSFEKRGQR
ncbi:MAG TPA: DbpA RNA binding domain-containing protein, partial [Ktedonobacterales bacterium]|nr:DbpA RNA binding domain-containing protein [Ktedonobacterales bacterium]